MNQTSEKQNTILAVDDDPLWVESLKLVLGYKYNLVTAHSVTEAMEALQRHRTDLVLMDINMPGQNGYEACRKIRLSPEFGHTKIILMSGSSTTEQRIKGYEAGADDFLSKPFHADELLAKIKVFLRLKPIEELDLMKHQLLSVVAHELRTPLSGIIPATEMLLSGDPMDQEQITMWGEMILENSHRLMCIADRSLLLSQFMTGDAKLDPEVFCLAAMAKDIVEETKLLAEKMETRVLLHGDTDLQVYADPRYIKMALRALLENALRYGE